MNITHRADLNAKAVCGAQGRISTAGAFVTCPACLAAQKPLSREQAMNQIRAAAAERAARFESIRVECERPVPYGC